MGAGRFQESQYSNTVPAETGGEVRQEPLKQQL